MAECRDDSNDELAPYILTNVEGLKEECEEAGHGAYGVIYNVTVNGLTYVAKRLHKALVKQVTRRESEEVKKKFRAECITLSKLHHPNIVHFVGVHYGHERGDITLVMESLHSDLSSFLEKHPHFPLPIKLSILLDVSYGLLYLHTHSPNPIVHRDLTARNILLTTDGRAKIADLGVAKLLTPQALMAFNKHTKAPGQPLYMPPEALTENPECTPKIDIFSFGHLSLFTINQEDPQVFEVSISSLKPEDLKQGCIQALKRRPSLEKVGQSHCMHPLITQCLHDDPTKRPLAVKLTSEVQKLCTKHPQIAEDSLLACEKIKSLKKEVSELMDEVETRTLEAQHEKESCETERQAIDSELKQVKRELAELKLQTKAPAGTQLREVQEKAATPILTRGPESGSPIDPSTLPQPAIDMQPCISVYNQRQDSQGCNYPQYSQAGEGGQTQYPYTASRDGMQGGHNLTVQGQQGYVDPSQYQGQQSGNVASIGKYRFLSGNLEQLRRNQMQHNVGVMAPQGRSCAASASSGIKEEMNIHDHHYQRYVRGRAKHDRRRSLPASHLGGATSNYTHSHDNKPNRQPTFTKIRRFRTDYRRPRSPMPLRTFSEHGYHTCGNQPGVLVTARQGSAGGCQDPPTQEQQSGDYPIYVNIGVLQPPKQSLGHQKLPQGEQNPTASPEPPSSVASLVQPAADQHSVDINDHIEDTADEVRAQVSGGREHTVTNVDKPFDPNLICPMCNKCFRIGEIQKFRHHVKKCEGTKNEVQESTIMNVDKPPVDPN